MRDVFITYYTDISRKGFTANNIIICEDLLDSNKKARILISAIRNNGLAFGFAKVIMMHGKKMSIKKMKARIGKYLGLQGKER